MRAYQPGAPLLPFSLYHLEGSGFSILREDKKDGGPRDDDPLRQRRRAGPPPPRPSLAWLERDLHRHAAACFDQRLKGRPRRCPNWLAPTRSR
jgi:hypothetical protein